MSMNRAQRRALGVAVRRPDYNGHNEMGLAPELLAQLPGRLRTAIEHEFGCVQIEQAPALAKSILGTGGEVDPSNGRRMVRRP